MRKLKDTSIFFLGMCFGIFIIWDKGRSLWTGEYQGRGGQVVGPLARYCGIVALLIGLFFIVMSVLALISIWIDHKK